jgi:hypothetical protein
MNSGSWPDVDDMITLSHDILIMLDDDDGIADLRQALEIGDEHIVVTRMEADRWLIENIDDPLKSGTDLRSESYSLRLTS